MLNTDKKIEVQYLSRLDRKIGPFIAHLTEGLDISADSRQFNDDVFRRFAGHLLQDVLASSEDVVNDAVLAEQLLVKFLGKYKR